MTQQTKAVATTSKAVGKAPRPLPEKYSYLQEIRDKKEEVEWIWRSIMTEGVDFGTIPGTPKPTLYKSGAEMLRSFYNHSINFEIDDTGTDRERGLFFFTVRASGSRIEPKTGVETYFGNLGVGHCNSLESKYRFRWVTKDQLPPDVAKADKPWEVWANRHGPATVKSKFGKGGKSFNLFRIDNDIPHDLANTILKMAKKRCFIDFELTVTGASRIFLVEDDLEGGKTPEVGEVVEEMTGEVLPREVAKEIAEPAKTLSDEDDKFKAAVVAQLSDEDKNRLEDIADKARLIIATSKNPQEMAFILRILIETFEEAYKATVPFKGRYTEPDWVYDKKGNE